MLAVTACAVFRALRRVVFKTPASVGVLCKLVREELTEILLRMIEEPETVTLDSPRVKIMVNGIASLLEATHFESSLRG